jgi:sec-independent protein translocase protein TatC
MDDTPRPLLEHLEELRRRLFWVVGTWAAAALLCGVFVERVFLLLTRPAVQVLRARDYSLVALAPAEVFFTYLKTALLVGFALSLPMTLYQAWAFVAPGLYANEKRFAAPFVISTTLLFACGCAFGYFVAFPAMFEYFLSLESEAIRTMWSVATVFGFVAQLYLAFGVAFQLPVIIFFLVTAGVVAPETFASGRRYAIVAMFVLGAILTPSPDAVSQLILSVPLVALYEAGLLLGRLALRRRAKRAALPQSLSEPTRSM